MNKQSNKHVEYDFNTPSNPLEIILEYKTPFEINFSLREQALIETQPMISESIQIAIKLLKLGTRP